MQRDRQVKDRLIDIVGEDKANLMCEYMESILEINEHINLTAIKNMNEAISKHLIDSLTCINLEEFKNAGSVIDVGTGGGFPGVPLAIACPDKKFVLMDSLNKRLKVIDELCSKLGITNVTTLHARAEEAARNKEYRDRFDVCVSRAVASLDTLTEWCMPFVKKGGYFISYKGAKAGEELKTALPAIKALGGKYIRTEDYLADEEGAEDHNLIVIEKIKETPKRFPRKPGEAKRNPVK